MKQIYLLLAMAVLASCVNKNNWKKAYTVTLNNPIIPGYFADPSVVQYEGKFYMYVTADPWGTDFLSCWVSDDFQNWTFHSLNWPTKAACTTELSEENKVWAPSVIRKGNTFYMYVSVGSEIWCGTAKHPLGPWKNALGNKPMISGDRSKYYHVIDAEAFIDDDGKAYLYWGSGWNWTNGHCFAAELNENMYSLKTKPVEVTPAHYFEAPFMLKRNGKYYLTYSEGKTIDETYEVRYAIGDNPFGPFKEAGNSPILKLNDSLKVYGPGHHTVFTYQNKDYILYHKHRLPFVKGTAYRQTCISELNYDEKKAEIKNIIPFGTQKFPNLAKNKKHFILPVSITASSENSLHKAGSVLDNNYSTRWEPSDTDKSPFLTASFKKPVSTETVELRFEYPWKKYYMKVETSLDGMKWITVADFTKYGVSGSPVDIKIKNSYKQIRLSFVLHDDETKPSIWDIYFIEK